MSVEIKVFGNVTLYDSWGDDARIAQIARVSTGSQNKGNRLNRKLLRTLLENDHGSPLEFGGLIFRFQLPLYLVAQIVRHRMASISQRSGRYVEMEGVFHKPPIWRSQAAGNRQMSADPLPTQDAADEIYQASILASWEAYQELLDLGVSREQARTVLPVSTETEMYMQFNLRSLMNFLRLRRASDAQGEIWPYVDLMATYFSLKFPLVSELFNVMIEVDRELAGKRHRLWTQKVDALDALEG